MTGLLDKADQRYRECTIRYDPLVYCARETFWRWSHDDYDGAPDSRDRRCGMASSPEECRAQIDEVLEDEADEPRGQTEAEARTLFDFNLYNGS